MSDEPMTPEAKAEIFETLIMRRIDDMHDAVGLLSIADEAFGSDSTLLLDDKQRQGLRLVQIACRVVENAADALTDALTASR